MNTGKRPVPLSPSAQVIADAKRREVAIREKPLLEALKESGYSLERLWDLFEFGGDKRVAVKLLIDEFPRITEYRVKATVARLLALPEAREHWPKIVLFFKNETETDGVHNGVKEALGATLSELADEENLSDVILLATNEENGNFRIFLFSFLASTSDPRGPEALEYIAHQDSVLARAAKVQLRLERCKTRVICEPA